MILEGAKGPGPAAFGCHGMHGGRGRVWCTDGLQIGLYITYLRNAECMIMMIPFPGTQGGFVLPLTPYKVPSCQLRAVRRLCRAHPVPWFSKQFLFINFISSLYNCLASCNACHLLLHSHTLLQRGDYWVLQLSTASAWASGNWKKQPCKYGTCRAVPASQYPHVL